MMRSLSSAVAGLRTHQTKMDVIGNNIANVNTFGFKASRATFSDVFYQNLGAASRAGNNVGGTNPTQIGYGSSVATVDVMNTQSAATSTDRALDVYITGDGFLVTQDPRGNPIFTRLGNLGFDESGNLVDPNGNYVMGFPLDADGNPVIPATGIATEVQPINVSPEILDQLTGISISTSGDIVGILPGKGKVNLTNSNPAWLLGSTATIDEETTLSGGIKLNLGGYLDKSVFAGAVPLNVGGTRINVTDVKFGDIGLDSTKGLQFSIKDGKVTAIGQKNTGKLDANNSPIYTPVEASGTLQNGEIVLKNSKGEIMFTIVTDYNGNAPLDDTPDPVPTLDGNNAPILSDPNDPNSAPVMAAPGTPYQIALVKMYQLTSTDKGGNTVTTGVQTIPGNGVLELTQGGFRINVVEADANQFAGSIGRAGLEDGVKLTLGALVLAKFRNVGGLQQAGSSGYMATVNSGEAMYVRPGMEGTGSLMANSLEMSNVDISKEFSDMITTQRGFQANTRIVTVSDEMLQELVNLKR